MSRKPNRRDMLKTAATLAAGYLGGDRVFPARAQEAKAPAARSFAEIDSLLHAAIRTGEVPGVVVLAATDGGIVYEGVFGQRRLNGGPAMTRDTVFRIASMVKLITSVAALQLVEQEKLALDAPAPSVESEPEDPQVLDGFDAKGVPQLRPAKRPILLRHLLTHTSGLTYRLWDAKALRYFNTLDHMPKGKHSKFPHTPLMFDPGERWQYGPSIDRVGRIVAKISGEPIGDYLRNHIFEPLGMKDTAFVISPEQRGREANVHRREANGTLRPLPQEKPPPPHETYSGGGGIYSTAPDYLTLLRALMHGGTLNGVQILRPETVALMGQNQIGDVSVGLLHTTEPWVSNDVDFFPGITRKWGYGHMLTMQPVPGGRSAGSMMWGGIYNTFYWIDPVRSLAAVFMTQVIPFADGRAVRLYRQFEHALYTAT